MNRFIDQFSLSSVSFVFLCRSQLLLELKLWKLVKKYTFISQTAQMHFKLEAEHLTLQ